MLLIQAVRQQLAIAKASSANSSFSQSIVCSFVPNVWCSVVFLFNVFNCVAICCRLCAMCSLFYSFIFYLLNFVSLSWCFVMLRLCYIWSISAFSRLGWRNTVPEVPVIIVNHRFSVSHRRKKNVIVTVSRWFDFICKTFPCFLADAYASGALLGRKKEKKIDHFQIASMIAFVNHNLPIAKTPFDLLKRQVQLNRCYCCTSFNKRNLANDK